MCVKTDEQIFLSIQCVYYNKLGEEINWLFELMSMDSFDQKGCDMEKMPSKHMGMVETKYGTTTYYSFYTCPFCLYNG